MKSVDPAQAPLLRACNGEFIPVRFDKRGVGGGARRGRGIVVALAKVIEGGRYVELRGDRILWRRKTRRERSSEQRRWCS